MNTLDILIVGVNTVLVLIVYQVLTGFWDYRIKQKLIKEGFIDEQSLDKIFHWNKKKERFHLIKTGIFSLSISMGLLLISAIGNSQYEGMPMIITIMTSLSVGSFLTLLTTKKI